MTPPKKEQIDIREDAMIYRTRKPNHQSSFNFIKVIQKHERCGVQSMSRTWIGALLWWGCALVVHAGTLDEYVQRPDSNFTWKVVEKRQLEGFEVTQINLTSQTWHNHLWTHSVQVARPATVRNPTTAFLLIAGGGGGGKGGNGNSLRKMLADFLNAKPANDASSKANRNLALMKTVSAPAGMLAAVVENVPNQPLFGDLHEDKLIAYSFDQYLKTGDETWPLLLPMVKSAVRAMDAVQAYAQREYHQKIEKFVVTGGSKRGWTTWLVAAIDSRVAAIAPMNIDMLNMKAQTAWAQQVYGRQSEKIKAYTDLHLVEQIDSPLMIKLQEIVDPYGYRKRYNLPKLLLLGTNDPYWTVDSLRHYWEGLPEPKLVYQAPNTGHSHTADSLQTMASVFQMVAEGRKLPSLEWQLSATGQGQVSAKVSQPAKAAHLWIADSPIRDFRAAHWTSRVLALSNGNREVSAEVPQPESGYRAFMAELTLTNALGQDYKLSTQVQVIPDKIAPIQPPVTAKR